MSDVWLSWPWATPVVAVALLAWSFLERRPPDSGPRWRDPAFLLPLLWPMYLLHQFEEHGVDVHGVRFAFLGAMCHTLGADELARCPADAPFVFAVNVIACPLAFGMTYAFRRARPALAALPWGIPLINAFAHVGAAVHDGSINPGLVTSLVLFVPLSLWVLRVLLVRRLLRPLDIGLVVGSGVALHAVLLGSVQLRARDVLDATALFVVNALNGGVPWLVGGVAAGLKRAPWGR